MGGKFHRTQLLESILLHDRFRTITPKQHHGQPATTELLEI
jgi:hypothetical protein